MSKLKAAFFASLGALGQALYSYKNLKKQLTPRPQPKFNPHHHETCNVNCVIGGKCACDYSARYDEISTPRVRFDSTGDLALEWFFPNARLTIWLGPDGKESGWTYVTKGRDGNLGPGDYGDFRPGTSDESFSRLYNLLNYCFKREEEEDAQ